MTQGDITSRHALNIEASVVIPTYNRRDELRRTLETLAQQQTRHSYEVVVADDGSAEDTLAVVRQFEAQLDIKYVRQPDAGFRLSAVRNLGAAAAKGRTLIFLDAGTLASRTLVQSYVDNVSAGSVALSGPTLGWDFAGKEAQDFRSLIGGPDWESRHREMSHKAGYPDYRSAKWRDVRIRRSPMALPWRFYWGRNIAVSRADFVTLGGFDEAFCSYGVEDIEFGYRLVHSGLSLEWSEDAWAVEMPSVKEDSDEQARQNRANLLRWADEVAHMEVEFYVCNRPLPQLEQPEWERILRWAGTSCNTEADLLELDALSRTPGRHLFIGLMSMVPHPPHVVTLGPNHPVVAGGWGEADAASHHAPSDINAIGLRTGFPSDSFDSVYVSDAMAPLANTWAKQLLDHARTLSRRVHTGDAFGETIGPEQLSASELEVNENVENVSAHA